MRGQQLRGILSDIVRAVNASGGAKHANILDKTQTALARFDDIPLEQIAEQIEAVAVSAVAPPWARHLAALEAAGISETDFLQGFAALTADKTLKKSDTLKLAQAYVGYVDKRASREKLLDAIKTRFYGKVYDHDANEMAKRATPW